MRNDFTLSVSECNSTNKLCLFYTFTRIFDIQLIIFTQLALETTCVDFLFGLAISKSE